MIRIQNPRFGQVGNGGHARTMPSDALRLSPPRAAAARVCVQRLPISHDEASPAGGRVRAADRSFVPEFPEPFPQIFDIRNVFLVSKSSTSGRNPQPTINMTNLTKREIVTEIYRKSGFPQKQIVDTVQQTLDIIQKALADGRNVELRNFGVLEVQVRQQRIGRNPNKPESTVVIPQRAVVKFKSGKILKQQLKKIDLAAFKRNGKAKPAADDGDSVEAHPMRHSVEKRESQPHS